MKKTLVIVLVTFVLSSNTYGLEDFFGASPPESVDSGEETNREALDLDYVEGIINPTNKETPAVPQTESFDDTSDLFNHHFGGFFGTNFFNPFNSFGVNSFNNFKPWYKGPNVCTSREESIEDEASNGTTSNSAQEPSFIHHFSLNVESCHETNSKHICKQITNLQGRKKTTTITKMCCHGFIRQRHGFCEKIDLKSISDTAGELGAKEFVKFAENNALNEVMQSNITIFLPTDESMKELTQNSVDNNQVALPEYLRDSNGQNELPMKSFILNHIAKGWTNIEDIDNEQMLTNEFDNHTIRLNVFPKIIGRREASRDDDEFRYLYTANCVKISKPNKLATNGIVHQVEKVLMPVTKNLMEIIKDRPDMTVLRTALEKTKLDAMLSDASDAKQFTIFAPTDSAFEKIDPQFKRKIKEGAGCAENILKNMIMDLTFCSAAVMDYDSRVSAFNLLGEKMIFEREKMENENSNETNEIEPLKLSQIMINGKVHITQEDLMATNGVLHVIDGVLETESALPITTMLGKNNLTIFKKLLEYGNFSDEYNSLENVTYFIPTDEAFESTENGKYWLEMLNESPKKLKNNEDLRKFLNYHVSPAIITSKDLSETTQPETLDGDSLRVNLYSTLPNFGTVFNRATINCARLIHFDQDSCGSVVHQVDNVLLVPEKSLFELLEGNPKYSEFLKLINAANLSSLLEEASDKGYTVLVPRNDVFSEVSDWMKERSKEELEELVKNHIINEVRCCSGIARIQWPFVGTVKTISNNYLTLNRDRRARIQNAGVTKCDILATNGIIHEVNDIIQVQIRRETAKNPFLNMFERLPFFKK